MVCGTSVAFGYGPCIVSSEAALSMSLSSGYAIAAEPFPNLVGGGPDEL